MSELKDIETDNGFLAKPIALKCGLCEDEASVINILLTRISKKNFITGYYILACIENSLDFDYVDIICQTNASVANCIIDMSLGITHKYPTSYGYHDATNIIASMMIDDVDIKFRFHIKKVDEDLPIHPIDYLNIYYYNEHLCSSVPDAFDAFRSRRCIRFDSEFAAESNDAFALPKSVKTHTSKIIPLIGSVLTHAKKIPDSTNTYDLVGYEKPTKARLDTTNVTFDGVSVNIPVILSSDDGDLTHTVCECKAYIQHQLVNGYIIDPKGLTTTKFRVSYSLELNININTIELRCLLHPIDTSLGNVILWTDLNKLVKYSSIDHITKLDCNYYEYHNAHMARMYSDYAIGSHTISGLLCPNASLPEFYQVKESERILKVCEKCNSFEDFCKCADDIVSNLLGNSARIDNPLSESGAVYNLYGDPNINSRYGLPSLD